jgi:hypothetical protein
MWSAIGSILLGVGGWLVTSFFGKPFVEFLELRKQVHEEIVYTDNIGLMQLSTPDYDVAVASLRRLGAKVQAIDAAAAWPLRPFLNYMGYDLPTAGRGLVGLSNSLAQQDGSRAVQKSWVQTGLKLPRDYTDEQLKQIEEIIQRGGTHR